LPATRGLLLYRKGQAEAGANHYIQSILKAHEMNEMELKHQAFFNFCFEELKIGHRTPMLDEESIKRIYGGSNVNRRIKILYQLILEPLLSVSKPWTSQSGIHFEYRNILDEPMTK
jgi:hypothetical protein